MEGMFRRVLALLVALVVAGGSLELAFGQSEDDNDQDEESAESGDEARGNDGNGENGGNGRDGNQDSNGDDEDSDSDSNHGRRRSASSSHKSERAIDETELDVEDAVNRALGIESYSSRHSPAPGAANIRGDIMRLREGMQSLEEKIDEYAKTDKKRRNSGDDGDEDSDDESGDDSEDQPEESDVKSSDSDDSDAEDDSSSGESNAKTKTKNSGSKRRRGKYSRKRRRRNLFYTVKNIHVAGVSNMGIDAKFPEILPNPMPYASYALPKASFVPLAKYKRYDGYGNNGKAKKKEITYRAKTYDGSTAAEISGKYADTDAINNYNHTHTVKTEYFKNPTECSNKTGC
ncbi:MAG: hypothetical protein LBJ16_02920 [Holosporaceae bacterium]|nr:hypothetical protein [Holosporaceae bacterium]